VRGRTAPSFTPLRALVDVHHPARRARVANDRAAQPKGMVVVTRRGFTAYSTASLSRPPPRISANTCSSAVPSSGRPVCGHTLRRSSHGLQAENCPYSRLRLGSNVPVDEALQYSSSDFCAKRVSTRRSAGVRAQGSARRWGVSGKRWRAARSEHDQRLSTSVRLFGISGSTRSSKRPQRAAAFKLRPSRTTNGSSSA
jgi:hypothetical protein